MGTSQMKGEGVNYSINGAGKMARFTRKKDRCKSSCKTKRQNKILDELKTPIKKPVNWKKI